MYGINYYTYRDVFRLLDVQDQLQVWRWITGHPLLRINEFITSPFRPTDTHPGCYVRKRHQLLLFTDFTDHVRYNKFTVCHAVAELNHCDLNEAATVILNKFRHNVDVNLICPKVKSSGVIKSENDRVIIDFDPYLYKDQPTWLRMDRDYWIQRNISKELLEQPHQPVFSVYCYYVNGKKYYPKSLPCFAYTFPKSNHVKIYQPKAPQGWKFPASTCTQNDVWEWLAFPPSDVCIVTKSYKDGAILHTIFPYTDIYAFQNEGCIPAKKIEELNRLYERVIILYDNDLPGIRAAYRLVEEFKVSMPLFYPKSWGKDTDDVLFSKGSNTIKSFLNQYLI